MSTEDLPLAQIAELEALSAMSDDDIDTSDIPEIREFSNPRRGMFVGSPNRRAVPNQEMTQQNSHGGTDDEQARN